MQGSMIRKIVFAGYLECCAAPLNESECVLVRQHNTLGTTARPRRVQEVCKISFRESNPRTVTRGKLLEHRPESHVPTVARLQFRVHQHRHKKPLQGGGIQVSVLVSISNEHPDAAILQ